jgi:hypothetical protein
LDVRGHQLRDWSASVPACTLQVAISTPATGTVALQSELSRAGAHGMQLLQRMNANLIRPGA